MISNQQSLNLNPYMVIYDLVVPKDNMLRQINDFVFVQDELQNIASITIAMLCHRFVCYYPTITQGTSKNEGKNQRDIYYFDVEKCRQCPFKNGCYKAIR
jgi:hypothetical protein